MDREQSGCERKVTKLEMGAKLKELSKELKEKLHKSPGMKYALLAALCGVLLLLLPNSDKSAQVFSEEPVRVTEEQFAGVEQRMEEILSNVDGAGRVEVMLVTKNEGITEYQTDMEETRQGDMTEIKTETVFSQRQENGGALIKKQTAPEYLGAVVISQGADRAEVRLRLTKAVCSLTGLSSDKVTVLKMGSNY